MLLLLPDRRSAMSRHLHKANRNHAWAQQVGGHVPTPARLSKLLDMGVCIGCGRSIPGKNNRCSDCQKAVAS
jgi:hypothetical protein